MSQAPFRYDIVGSFLRPQEVKDARAAFEAGKISKEDLRTIEDKAIKELVEKEKKVGLKAVTDGEFRRAFWHIDFLEELIGVNETKAETWSTQFKGHNPKALTLKVEGKIDFPEDHPHLADFKYLKSIAGDDVVAKMTIPSPSMLYHIVAVRGAADYQPLDHYKDDQVFFDDLADTYIKAVHAFYNAGCRYLQIDDTSWGEFCDSEKVKGFKANGVDTQKVQEKYVEVINKIVAAKPADLTLTLHICRGNFRSTYFSSGAYDAVAELLFGHCHVDGFFLEFDTDRSGTFAPLAKIKNQKVVLGLVTSKFPELEDPDQVKARIKDAEQYISKDQLCLSPQCGFSSTEEGNELLDEDQWKKLALIKEIAEDVWEDA